MLLLLVLVLLLEKSANREKITLCYCWPIDKFANQQNSNQHNGFPWQMSLGWLKKRHMKPASTDSNIICFFSKRLDEGSGGIRGAFSRGIRGGSGSIWPGDPGGSGGIRGDPRTLCEDGPAARAAGSMLFYCVRHENGQSARSGQMVYPGGGTSRIIILRAGQHPRLALCM